MMLSISKDGSNFVDIGTLSGQPTGIDIAPFVQPGDSFRFVRIIDVENDVFQNSPAAGADIDAVGAIGSITIAACDFNLDGKCNSDDIDLMQDLGPLAQGFPATEGESFDLNGDEIIDRLDRDQWLADAAVENAVATPYKVGDANLDGFVDLVDFDAWNSSKFSFNLQWSAGNFNADGVVDTSDFNLWLSNRFATSESRSAPEPRSAFVTLLPVIVLVNLRRRRM